MMWYWDTIYQGNPVGSTIGGVNVLFTNIARTSVYAGALNKPGATANWLIMLQQ